MLDVRYSHLYFYQSLNRLQRGLSAIAELLVYVIICKKKPRDFRAQLLGYSAECGESLFILDEISTWRKMSLQFRVELM